MFLARPAWGATHAQTAESSATKDEPTAERPSTKDEQTALSAGEWYVARDGERFGPFTSDRMSAGVREGELRREDLVWRDGMPDWQPASEVPGLWRPPPLPGPNPAVTRGITANLRAVRRRRPRQKATRPPMDLAMAKPQ